MTADTAASPVRCAIYTRVSTEEQGREGASLGVQLQTCRQHAAGQGWVVIDELQDVQSGLDNERVAYQRALDLARSRSIDVVLVWRLDRFGRDDAEALPRLREFARLQVRVVSATEGEQSAFLQKLMFLLANEESRRTSERVRPAMRKRVEEGLWMGKPPFGYRMDPTARGRLVIDDATADQLFWRHVAELAKAHLRIGRGAADRRLRDAEIDHLGLAFERDQDIGRRDIAVHEVERGTVVARAAVRIGEPVREFATDEQREVDREALLALAEQAERATQVAAFDELEREEVLVADATDLEDLRDVDVLELDRDLSLVDEARDELCIGREVREHLLDHTELLEAGEAMLREENLSHTAPRETLDQEVPTEHLWQPLDPPHRAGLRIFDRYLQHRHPNASEPPYNDHFRPPSDLHVSL